MQMPRRQKQWMHKGSGLKMRHDKLEQRGKTFEPQMGRPRRRIERGRYTFSNNVFCIIMQKTERRNSFWLCYNCRPFGEQEGYAKIARSLSLMDGATQRSLEEQAEARRVAQTPSCNLRALSVLSCHALSETYSTADL
jgi:hypothetical protein